MDFIIYKNDYICRSMKIDCHCHILPGIDDGAKTLDEAVFLSGWLVKHGYERAICTAHCSFLFRNTPETVIDACNLLREELERRGIKLDLVPSMEYRFTESTWPTVRLKDWLMPWEGNHILIELPLHTPSQMGSINPVDEIRSLIDDGYQPVLAHPERYTYLEMDDIRALKNAGAEFQRNLGSLEGWYDEDVSARAREMVAEGLFDWIGTDLHNERYADFFDNNVFNKKGRSSIR